MVGGHSGAQSVIDKFNASLGQKLRAARRQRGWSLGAVETNTTGEFKASVLGAYERGERAISVQRFVRLAEIYDIGAIDLLPLEASSDITIDLDALSASTSDDLVERYLAAIQLLRKDPTNSEIRRGDQAILGSLVQSVSTSTTSDADQ
jgi:transcriptional regulator with XRE-family HTH domain